MFDCRGSDFFIAEGFGYEFEHCKISIYSGEFDWELDLYNTLPNPPLTSAPPSFTAHISSDKSFYISRSKFSDDDSVITPEEQLELNQFILVIETFEVIDGDKCFYAYINDGLYVDDLQDSKEAFSDIIKDKLKVSPSICWLGEFNKLNSDSAAITTDNNVQYSSPNNRIKSDSDDYLSDVERVIEESRRKNEKLIPRMTNWVMDEPELGIPICGTLFYNFLMMTFYATSDYDFNSDIAFASSSSVLVTLFLAMKIIKLK
jgi:hypothetical protein